MPRPSGRSGARAPTYEIQGLVIVGHHAKFNSSIAKAVGVSMCLCVCLSDMSARLSVSNLTLNIAKTKRYIGVCVQ